MQQQQQQIKFPIENNKKKLVTSALWVAMQSLDNENFFSSNCALDGGGSFVWSDIQKKAHIKEEVLTDIWIVLVHLQNQEHTLHWKGFWF